MYNIRNCTVSEVLDYASKLFSDHWDEICVHKKIMELKPDAKAYLALEEQGKLIVLGAFNDDVLVGYSVNITGNHLHYANLKYVSNDLLFIAKEYRASPLGLRLMRDTEKAAKDIGANVILWHCKENSTLEKILNKKQYRVQDVIYSKEV